MNRGLLAFAGIFVVSFALFGAAVYMLQGLFGCMQCLAAGLIVGIPAALLFPLALRFARSAGARAAVARGEYEERNRAILARVASYATLGSVPPPAGVVLDAGERCIYYGPCTAYCPQTTVHQTVYGYGGYGGGIFGGSAVLVSIPSTDFRAVGDGTLLITNERIVWIGRFENASFGLREVFRFSAFQDGFQLDRESGLPWIFKTGTVESAAYAYRALHG